MEIVAGSVEPVLVRPGTPVAKELGSIAVDRFDDWGDSRGVTVWAERLPDANDEGWTTHPTGW